MPTKTTQKFDAWSMSRLNDWLSCPAKAKYKHLLKMKEPTAPAMQRGSVIHAKAAAAVMEPTKAKLPVELALFKAEFKGVREIAAEYKQAELQWAFSSAWKLLPTFFDRSTWVRMILDLRWNVSPTEINIVDYKTGRVYEKNREQNKLYALGEFMAHPETEVVNTKLWYLDQGEEIEDQYKRSEAPALMKFWDVKSRDMMRATKFDPTPSDAACRFCFYAKAKGGPCEY